MTIFLLSVRPIPNDPSARIWNLVADSKRKEKILGLVDKIAFGTGDKRGIVTISNDGKFKEEAERQLKIELNAVIFGPISYIGK